MLGDSGLKTGPEEVEEPLDRDPTTAPHRLKPKELKPSLNPKPYIITHRSLTGSLLWFIFRTLLSNPKKELLRGLWV